MASIATQSDQTVEVLTQFWSKMGPKGDPKMGPPEVGTKTKWKNIFYLALVDQKSRYGHVFEDQKLIFEETPAFPGATQGV